MTVAPDQAPHRSLTQARPSPLHLVVGAAALLGAILYGAAFTYFSYTTLYALKAGIPTYEALWTDLGTLYTVHGGLMVAGGLLFGGSVLRAGSLLRNLGLMGMGHAILFGREPGSPARLANRR
jgi:hypothetical protein